MSCDECGIFQQIAARASRELSNAQRELGVWQGMAFVHKVRRLEQRVADRDTLAEALLERHEECRQLQEDLADARAALSELQSWIGEDGAEASHLASGKILDDLGSAMHTESNT